MGVSRFTAVHMENDTIITTEQQENKLFSVLTTVNPLLPTPVFPQCLKAQEQPHTRVSKFTLAVLPSTVTPRTEPSFTLTQSSPNMSLGINKDTVLVEMHL